MKRFAMLGAFMILSALPWDSFKAEEHATSYRTFYDPTYPCVIMRAPHGKFLMTEPGLVTFIEEEQWRAGH